MKRNPDLIEVAQIGAKEHAGINGRRSPLQDFRRCPFGRLAPQ